MTAWKLIIEDDAGKTIVVPLARDEITIGRKEGNTIRLTERNVSRFHARLTRQNGHVFIQDCESYTGVRINGDRIRGQVEVREGDLIEIGDYHLALQAEGARPALAGAQPPVTTQPATPVSAASTNAFNAEDDEDSDQFAGDTQRWEPPDEMESPLLGALPTEEGGALLPETETQRYTAPLVDDPTREETARIDSTDPTFPGSNAPAPISALGDPVNPFARDDDETQRTPSVPLGQPIPNPALDAATLPGGALPQSAAPAPSPDDDDTLATPALSPRMADPEEATEAVHVAPGIEEVLLQRARLVALNTVFAGTVLPFDQDEMVIGRTEDNDLVIQHKSVSRNHARIVREGDRWRMEDLGSANGILVNNAEVGSALLSSGDVVELGRVRLRFVAPGEPFELSADEIARARVADASGEEWDEPATHVTSPSRDRLIAAGKKRSPLVPIAIGVGALAVIAVVVVLLAGGGGEEVPASEPVKATATGEVDAKSAAVAAERMAEAKKHLEDGKPDLARLAAQDAVDSGGGPAAQAILDQAVAAQKAASSILVARNQLERGRYEDALVSAEALEGTAEADEARRIATTAKARLVEEYVAKARTAHDEDRRADRQKALTALRRHDAARADELEASFVEEDGAAAAAADDEVERTRKSSATRKPPKRTPPKRVQAREQRPEEPTRSPEEIAAEVDALEKQATQALFAGNAAAAAKHLEDARKLSPRRATLYRGLGQAYEKLGKQKKAAWAYETYLKYSPGAPDRDLVKKKIQDLGGS